MAPKSKPDRRKKSTAKKRVRTASEKPFVLTESLEDYLETIKWLMESEEHGHAHIHEIAKKLRVKMPSVTNAVGVLCEHGYLNYKTSYPVTLTALGEEAANRVIYRHHVLNSFLRDILQLPEEESSAIACRIEHVISETFIKRLDILSKTLLHGQSEALCKALTEAISKASGKAE